MSAAGHVLLVGLPGSGKSTVGPLLAARLRTPFLDTDAEVERRLGMSVADVFAMHGEARFRAEERAVLEAALDAAHPSVIAAGGGLVAQPGAAELANRCATVVLLDAPDDVLAERLGPAIADRPLLAGDPASLHRLRAERSAAHAGASLRIDVAGVDAGGAADLITSVLRASVRVATAQPYLVRVGTGLVERVGDHLPAGTRRVAVIADEAVAGVAETIAVRLRLAGQTVAVLAVRGGEEAKTWAGAGALLERCSEAGLERGDCIVAVGGGSVGDVAGLVAATYLRGVAWIVVPTTLLAMVDSAVGGKTAINLRRGKNLAGAFWQPRAVLCDPDVLATLSQRSFRSAFAEIVKSAMIGSAELAALVDAELPRALRRDLDAVGRLILGCCALKAAVVGADERENGRRAVLNYGHTVGHAVEALTGLGAGLDHGEAVAYGMRVAGALSVVEAGCPAGDVAHQDALLDACGLTHRPRLPVADITAHLAGDKKSRAGVPRWVLLRRRGDPVTGVVVDPATVARVLSTAVAA